MHNSVPAPHPAPRTPPSPTQHKVLRYAVPNTQPADFNCMKALLCNALLIGVILPSSCHSLSQPPTSRRLTFTVTVPTPVGSSAPYFLQRVLCVFPGLSNVLTNRAYVWVAGFSATVCTTQR